ncbi:DNA mismatch repair protein [Geranomyces variabilis]|nr:DNA mismatch repair protein [Geranomyces variabilis]
MDGADESPAQPQRDAPQPGRIKRLDEAVINRIAAGEIIHRPANALKEMIENSLDAGATSVQITVKDGGLKLLQIQDNGSGIHKDDLNMVCERFATSKLKRFDDLSTIATYGFRGEALASISHVAHVTVTTKQENSPCAWRAFYADGKLKPAKPGMSPDPKPCAGNKGTQIVVEDLFYNVTTRRRALKSPSDEYNRILQVVHRYAIHNSKTSFTCKKYGANTADVHTASSARTLDNIRYVHGAAIAKELLDVAHTDDAYDFSVDGYVSNANFNTKQMTLILFINHRSVDSSNLKRAIEAVYTEYLPRGTHPFVYLSLDIKPENVDVNVHPTKREVHFLNEDKIIESVCGVLQRRLADANHSRTFYTQTILPGASSIPADGPPTAAPLSQRAPEHKLVRTDARTRTLDAYITNLSSSSSISSTAPPDDDDGQNDDGGVRKRARIEDENADVEVQMEESAPVVVPVPANANAVEAMDLDEADDVAEEVPVPPPRKRIPVEVRLTSVLELRDEVQQARHRGLTEVFATHTFVGFVDDSLALIQAGTRLYMVDFEEWSQELFYQLCLQGFSNFGTMHLPRPISVREGVLMVLEDGEEYDGDGEIMANEDIAEECATTLTTHRAMLLEYFSLTITPTGEITSLPVLLRNYVPRLDKLPAFLLALGGADFTAEKPCFRDVCRAIGTFYAVEGVGVGEEQGLARAEHRWTVEHVVFAVLKAGGFVAPRGMVEAGGVVMLADLPDLYRVFERC